MVTLTSNTLVEGAAPGTVIGSFVITPSIANLSLLDDQGGRFDIVGDDLVAGQTPTDYETATGHTVIVRCERGVVVNDVPVAVVVTNANDLDVTLTGASISEAAAQNALVGTLASAPVGASFVITDTAAGRFALSGDTIVRGPTALDFETNQTHAITIEASLNGDVVSKTFTVSVTNVVEITNVTLSAASTPETSTPGTAIGTLATVPAGGTFTLIDNAGGRFALSGGQIVRGAAALDYETATSHQITVRGARGGETLDKVLTISVTDVAEITDVTLTGASTPESSASGAAVGTLATVPAGGTFSLVDGAGGRFVVVGSAVQRGPTALDYETATTHQITVRGARAGETLDKVLTISVSDVDEISDIAISNAATPEDSPNGTAVGALSSTPAGATFALTDTAGGRFALSGSNIVRGATALDYEAAQSHNIVVRGTRLSETFDKTLTITVGDVDEISAIALSNNAIAENAAQGGVVGALSSTPAGAVFALTDTASNRFDIVGGNLVRGSTALDFETAASHTVTVRGTRLGETFDQTFTVNVSNVNEISSISLSNASVPENSVPGTTVGTLSTAPPGATFTLTDTAGDRFAVSGANLVAGSTSLDYETATSHVVTVQANLGADVATQNFTITVSDVNEAPPLMTPNNLSITPGSNSAFGFAETPPVTPTSTMATNGSGTGTGYTFLWTLDSGDAVIDSPNTQATTFSAPPGTKGTGSHLSVARCTVRDSSGAEASRTTALDIQWA